MRKFIKEYFSFSHSEIRIIIILSGLILFSLLFRIFIPSTDIQQFKLTEDDNIAIDSFINSLEKSNIVTSNTDWEVPARQFIKNSSIPKRNFDPNIVTAKELDEIGFPGFIAKNLVRYRKAGGKFREKSDLKKLYGFSDSIFREWEAYIIIPQSDNSDPSISGYHSYANVVLDLNSADTTELLEISGIGPYFAGELVKYRNKLGGYYNIYQLLEIYGMDTLKLDKIKNQLEIDSLYLTKMNINTITINDLKKHPYLSRRLAEAIIKYRQFSGNIVNITELLENRILTQREFDKLKPYLKTMD